MSSLPTQFSEPWAAGPDDQTPPNERCWECEHLEEDHHHDADGYAGYCEVPECLCAEWEEEPDD